MKVIGRKMTKDYCKGVEYDVSEEEGKRAIDAGEVRDASEPKVAKKVKKK